LKDNQRLSVHRTLFAGTAACLLALSSLTLAQLRTLPDDAKRARMDHVQGMVVDVNGTRMQLSSGAQIRSQENRILVPGALPPSSLVKYLVDAAGNIHRVWILTDEEAARPDKRRD